MSASRVGKWRYRVSGPTPACLAISSRLASAPRRVNASLATSKMRSRFRRASVRGFRDADFERFVAIGKILVTGDSLRSSTITETLSILPKLACRREENKDDGTDEAGWHIWSFRYLNQSLPNGLWRHATGRPRNLGTAT